jgi:hypothetical protein
MNEGKEFKREGHGHDYSTPVAGEDGGTEDQSKTEKSIVSSEKNQPTKQGNTRNEKSTI